MGESATGVEAGKVLARFSVMTPKGCLIRCPCGNVFSPVNEAAEEICDECQRIFLPGYVFEAEIMSRYSGMSLGYLRDEDAGENPEDTVQRVATRKYGEDGVDLIFWEIKNSTPAYFHEADDE